MLVIKNEIIANGATEAQVRESIKSLFSHDLDFASADTPYAVDTLIPSIGKISRLDYVFNESFNEEEFIKNPGKELNKVMSELTRDFITQYSYWYTGCKHLITTLDNSTIVSLVTNDEELENLSNL